MLKGNEQWMREVRVGGIGDEVEWGDEVVEGGRVGEEGVCATDPFVLTALLAHVGHQQAA